MNCAKRGDPCGQAVAAATSDAVPTDEHVYNQFYFACHDTGVGGAPKMGHPDEWAPPLAKDNDAISKSVMNGLTRFRRHEPA